METLEKRFVWENHFLWFLSFFESGNHADCAYFCDKQLYSLVYVYVARTIYIPGQIGVKGRQNSGGHHFVLVDAKFTSVMPIPFQSL